MTATRLVQIKWHSRPKRRLTWNLEWSERRTRTAEAARAGAHRAAEPRQPPREPQPTRTETDTPRSLNSVRDSHPNIVRETRIQDPFSSLRPWWPSRAVSVCRASERDPCTVSYQYYPDSGCSLPM